MKFKHVRSAVMLLPLATALLSAAPAQAASWSSKAQSGQQDPPSGQETDQVRDARNQPVERIKLYQKYLEDRIDKIKEIGPNPKAEDLRNELRAKYEEFTRLADELQDNLDTLDAAHADIRKALKDLVSDSEKWPEVLNRAAANQSYDFSRQTALEAAQSTIEVSKKLYEEQKQYFTAHKDEAGKNGTGPS